jgi:hypothetical protein
MSTLTPEIAHQIADMLDQQEKLNIKMRELIEPLDGSGGQWSPLSAAIDYAYDDVEPCPNWPRSKIAKALREGLTKMPN